MMHDLARSSPHAPCRVSSFIYLMNHYDTQLQSVVSHGNQPRSTGSSGSVVDRAGLFSCPSLYQSPKQSWKKKKQQLAPLPLRLHYHCRRRPRQREAVDAYCCVLATLALARRSLPQETPKCGAEKKAIYIYKERLAYPENLREYDGEGEGRGRGWKSHAWSLTAKYPFEHRMGLSIKNRKSYRAVRKSEMQKLQNFMANVAF